ncbi:NAD(P)/FAD-dependent oxidoreductase [Xylanibacillus composti]|nr:FAD-dependent oxidoreductase [Xylanibacillus composti]MDT9723512.1 NAD(P)/FAD-dependent oxidoreductase [Xylanibacillus composti]
MKAIVILGGGYGGVSVVHQLLEQDLPADHEIILVDRMPFQGLKTEYYAVASGTVADVDVRVPFPQDPRVRMVYGVITEIDLENRKVHLEDQAIGYEQLVIALGCTDKYHNIPGAEPYTHSIQSFSSTRETFCRISDVKPYGQVSIVGGGLSGVELASELREARPDLNVRILDRGASILSAFPDKLQEYVRDWFQAHQVEMLAHANITRVEQGVLYNGNEAVYTDLTVWTAGIQPARPVQLLDLPKDAQGRLEINVYHQLPAYPNVYVVGDCASLPFSPSAQLAEAQGKQVAEVMQALWKGETPELGQIKLKGILGSLGKKAGFGLMGKRMIMMGRVPRVLKSGVLWMSKQHFG